MTIYFNGNLLKNHFLSTSRIPMLYLWPTDGMGLLGSKNEYASMQRDPEVNAWVDELCQDAPFDWFSVITEGKSVDTQQTQVQSTEAATFKNVKEITYSISENSLNIPNQTARKSNRVLLSRKALFGALKKKNIEIPISFKTPKSPVASSIARVKTAHLIPIEMQKTPC